MIGLAISAHLFSPLEVLGRLVGYLMLSTRATVVPLRNDGAAVLLASEQARVCACAFCVNLQAFAAFAWS